jgi:methylated-DNA-[protein]-cysteine S-methyltransferase
MGAAFALFETAIGWCGIAWNAYGLVGVQLPGAGAAETRAGILGRFPAAEERDPPPQVLRAMEGVAAVLRGEPSDLADIALDMEGLPPFRRRVFEEARQVPAGATLSYGELAARCGAPGAARAVGQALGRNPFPLIVPCHRILAAGGRPGGFTAPGGVALKLRLLGCEGVRPRPRSPRGTPPPPSATSGRRTPIWPA